MSGHAACRGLKICTSKRVDKGSREGGVGGGGAGGRGDGGRTELSD